MITVKDLIEYLRGMPNDFPVSMDFNYLGKTLDPKTDVLEVRWLMRDTGTDEPFYPPDLPIQVCQSGAGYYIGQLEPSGAPFTRLSGYYGIREDAEKDLTCFELRDAPENDHVVKAMVKKGKIQVLSTSDEEESTQREEKA